MLLHQLRHFQCDFNVNDKDRFRTINKAEKWWSALLKMLICNHYCKSVQFTPEFARKLNDHTTITKRLIWKRFIKKENRFHITYRKMPLPIDWTFIFHWSSDKRNFLYWIVISDKKWIYFDNLKWEKSWINSGQLATFISGRNIHGSSISCIWWNQEDVVYYELLNPKEIVIAECINELMMQMKVSIK